MTYFEFVFLFRRDLHFVVVGFWGVFWFFFPGLIYM